MIAALLLGAAAPLAQGALRGPEPEPKTATYSGAAPCAVAGSPGLFIQTGAFGTVLASSQDAAQAAAVGAEIARQAARDHLGIDPPPILIAPPDRTTDPLPAGCGFAFAWPFSRGIPSHVLPHEIGHTMFIRFLAPRSRLDEYGGGAPDWLDEMAALAFEDADGIAMRRADAARFAARGELIPLARLLAMPHPEWSARRDAAADDTQAGNTAPTVTGEPSGPAVPRPSVPRPAGAPQSFDTPTYYATVRALLDLLVARTGRQDVIALLARDIAAGTPSAAAIAALPGMDALDLDTELDRYVKIDPDYRTVYRSIP